MSHCTYPCFEDGKEVVCGLPIPGYHTNGRCNNHKNAPDPAYDPCPDCKHLRRQHDRRGCGKLLPAEIGYKDPVVAVDFPVPFIIPAHTCPCTRPYAEIPNAHA